LDDREYAVDVMAGQALRCGGLRQHSSAPEDWSWGRSTQTQRKGKGR
jgi:hypothetical protein